VKGRVGERKGRKGRSGKGTHSGLDPVPPTFLADLRPCLLMSFLSIIRSFFIASH